MPWCGIWLLVFLIPGEAWSYMDHGGRISRDFAIVDSVNTGGEEDLVFLAWGGTGSKKERITLFALCADGKCGSSPVPDESEALHLFDNSTPPVLRDTSRSDRDFCDNSLCWHSSDYPEDPEDPRETDVELRCEGSPACSWAVEIPGSRGNTSHAPPVLDVASNRVFLASVDEGGGGSVWAFDLEGQLQGLFRPKIQHVDPSAGGKARYKNHVSGGFYARPAVFPYRYTAAGEQEHGSLVLLPGIKNAYLYVLDGSDLRTVIAAFPISEDLQSSGGRVRAEPIVEDMSPGGCEFRDTDNTNSQDGSWDCTIRVSVGVENGGKKRGLYVYDIDLSVVPGAVNSDGVQFAQFYDINPGDTDPPQAAHLHYALRHDELPAVLGGEAILEKTLADGTKKRFLVMTLSKNAGVALIDLTGAQEALDLRLLGSQGARRTFDQDEAEPFIAIHPTVEQTHRTRPMVHRPCQGTCDPEEVYIGQKGGGDHAGGRVYRFRFDPALDLTTARWPDWSTGFGEIAEGPRWDSVLEGASPVSTTVSPVAPWPDCLVGGEGITTTSWSSPFPHFIPRDPLDSESRDTTYVFVGSSHESDQSGGVYRLVIPSGEPDACPEETAADAWFDYDLSRGWRTTAIATENDVAQAAVPWRLHVGTSNERFFTLDLLGEGGPGSEEALTQWCYDLRTGFQYGPDPEDDGDPKTKSWAEVCLVNGD